MISCKPSRLEGKLEKELEGGDFEVEWDFKGSSKPLKGSKGFRRGFKG